MDLGSIAWPGVMWSRGVIAARLESGELALWDPSKILAGDGYVYLHPPSLLDPQKIP